MKNLQKYCAEKNTMRIIFGQHLLDPLNPRHQQDIANKLDADLSPENISCDGELSRAQVAKRYKLYSAAAKELRVINPAVHMYEA